MNKNIGIIISIIGIVFLVLVGNGIYAFMNNKSSETLPVEVENKNSAVPVETNITTEKNNIMEIGSYEAYAPEKLTRAQAGDVVLFFYASWCPSCRGLNLDIENNLSSIPAGVSIFKTNYDQETELKKKYGITYQHTLVQVDQDGNLIKKWSGSPSLNSLLSQIK